MAFENRGLKGIYRLLSWVDQWAWNYINFFLYKKKLIRLKNRELKN